MSAQISIAFKRSQQQQQQQRRQHKHTHALSDIGLVLSGRLFICTKCICLKIEINKHDSNLMIRTFIFYLFPFWILIDKNWFVCFCVKSIDRSHQTQHLESQ